MDCVGVKLKGLSYKNQNNNTVIKVEGFIFPRLQKLSFNSSGIALKDIIYNLNRFLILVEYSINLKYLSQNFEFDIQPKEELLGIAFELLNKKDVWKKLKRLNVLKLKIYIFIYNFLDQFFEIPTL